MDRAARLLRGTLRVRVESAFPERVLNLCGAHGIAFSDLRWESVSALSFTVRAAERKKLERLLAPLDAALTVERAAGAPFFLRRFRRRYTLLAGLALMLALFFANSFFIWDFEVSGSETVPAEKILRVLEKQGLRRGSFAYSFRPQDICNRALPELPGVLGSQVNIADWRHEMKAIFRAGFQHFRALDGVQIDLIRLFFGQVKSCRFQLLHRRLGECFFDDKAHNLCRFLKGAALISSARPELSFFLGISTIKLVLEAVRLIISSINLTVDNRLFIAAVKHVIGEGLLLFAGTLCAICERAECNCR